MPLVPLIPLALRLGLMTAAGYAVRRLVAARRVPGRTDQRVEDALDDLAEGIAIHRPPDRADAATHQTNTAARLKRTLSFGTRRVEVDAAVITRFRIRKG